MIDRDTIETLLEITWQQKEGEWLGQLKNKVGNWQTIANIMACIRCPWRQNRKRFVASPGLNPQNLIDIVIRTGIAPAMNANDYFATPPAGAAELVAALPQDDFAADDNTDTFLEPSAGTGAIVEAIKRRYPKARITAIEYDPLNAAILKHLHPEVEVIKTDFLTWETDRRFDHCVMNPPFSANGGYEAHIPKALTLLRPNRYLVTLNTAGAIFASKRNQPWRGWLAQHEAEIWKFEHAFDDTATNIDAYLLRNCDPAWRYEPHDGHPNYPTKMLFHYLDNDYELSKQRDEWCETLFTDHAYPRNNLGALAIILRTIQENKIERKTIAPTTMRRVTEWETVRNIDTWDVDTYDEKTMLDLANQTYGHYLEYIAEVDPETIADYFPPAQTLITVEPTKRQRTPKPPTVPTKTKTIAYAEQPALF